MTTTALCRHATTSAPDVRCGQIATIPIIGGCVHEHVEAIYVCTQHAPAVLGGTTICRLCLLGTDPHRCRVLAREVTP